MKVNFSKHIDGNLDLLGFLVMALEKDFNGVSVLATDCVGLRLSVDYSGSNISDATLAERGYVVRVFNGTFYSEHSFNELSSENMMGVVSKIKQTAKDDVTLFKASGIKFGKYPLNDDQNITDSYFGEVEILPESMTIQEKLDKMKAIVSRSKVYAADLVDCKAIYEELVISKAFVTSKTQLTQAYMFSTANVLAVAKDGDNMQYEYGGVSGMKGVEILDALAKKVESTIDQANELLSADRVVPGTYDVICDPNVTGLIAHEAFGHGVEMDMFVKNRAKGAEFIGQYVASEKTNMYDGAKSAKHVASFLFDDEGTLGTSTKIIDKGVLKSGISDLLSAMKLYETPTGNGRRESFERKAYARMTNTFFDVGEDKLSDMIKSIDYGYMLENYKSGMEDPKNWGIQCIISKGREIKDGKFTGKIVAPVMMTGYVPDVLKSITMVSNDELYLNGSGHCGKGYKEWMKTSIGGTYIKLRGRLG